MSGELEFRGARGSNTGDVYHELWAVRSALKLLDSTSKLEAVTVEGVPSADGFGHQWDGVDCTLLYGGTSIQTADRVTLQQLKYSASEPNTSWSPSRACYGPSSTDPSSSLMRGLGKAFRETVKLRKGRPLSDISVELVTNQPVSDLVVSAINRAKSDGVPGSFKTKWQSGGDKLHRLVHASGLSPKEFQDFSKCLKFVSQTNSRFLLEEKMLMEVSAWTESEFAEVALRLRNFIRNEMMMPETAGEIINKESVLLQFGVSEIRALFPCPAKVKPVTDLVSREISKELCNCIIDSDQRILLHGSGGVGKSTIIQEFQGLLPEGSEVIVFDCYGAGSYMDASAMRHRPRDAFVQLANELANRLNIPAFLAPRSGLDFARAFHRRLILASETLSKVRPGARLVIVVDAADNSISAANARVPKEESFVAELISFEDLPKNVALVISARTGRRDDLKLPSSFKPFELPPFSRPETGEFVAHFWEAPEEWVDDFHRLTNGTPRVQNYAFGKTSGKPSEALDPLRPNGKTLEAIFHEQFDEAVKKAGGATKVEETCAALAVLPRPIPVGEIAHALNLSDAQILDICSDLEPGIRVSENTISFADEDFEHFALVKGQKSIPEIRSKVARRMLADYRNSEYAALNVVPLLLKAEMGAELLGLVESEPEPSTSNVRDPVLRMEIRNQRLTNAISVCRSAGNLEQAVRFVLIGAEALETDDATRKILTDFPNLTARFTGPTGSRLILSDPDQVEQQGPLLLSILSKEAELGNLSQVREVRRRISAWFKVREDALRDHEEQFGHASGWNIGSEDMANALIARALEEGAQSAIQLFRHWPVEFAASTARIAIRRLVADQRFKILQDIGNELSPLLAPFILVPLRLAGQPVNLKKLAQGLRLLSRRYPISAKTLDDLGNSSSLKRAISEVLLNGAEVLAAHNADLELVKAITTPLSVASARRIDKLYDHQTRLMDGILRSYCLQELLVSGSIDHKNMLVEPQEVATDRGAKTKRTESDSERRIRSVVEYVAPFYSRRAEYLIHRASDISSEECLAELLKSFSRDGWRFDQNNRTLKLRSVMAEGLVVLVAANIPIKPLSKFSFETLKGFWPQGETSVTNLFSSLTAFGSLHDELLDRTTDAVNNLAKQRMGAREKSEALANFAELIAPVSSDDANVIFQKAIAVAHELDSEAIDQIRFLHTLVLNQEICPSFDKKHYASVAAEFFVDAGIRLENVEHFPWKETMESIAALHFPTALACSARWDDSSYVSAHETFEPALHFGVDRGDLDPVQAAALLKLVGRPSARTISAILNKTNGLEASIKRKLVEEFARDLVTEAIDVSNETEILLLSQKGDVWLDRLRRLNDLKNSIEDPPEEKCVKQRKQARPESVLTKKSWDQETLSQAEILYPVAEALLKETRVNKEYISLSGVLHHASLQVQVGNRTKFLSALVEIIVEYDEPQLVETLLGSIKAWKLQLSVEAWCETRLPQFIGDAFPYLVSRYAGDAGRLEEALVLAKLTAKAAEEIILEGLERNGLWLSSHQIFGLVQRLAKFLDDSESSSLLSWYLDRLVDRIAPEDKENVDQRGVPDTITNAVAYFVVAYLSDVDLRLRWKAAHAGRRLARLGHVEELKAILELYERAEDNVFRAPEMPYYWLAARLWMMIMFDRICLEMPSTVEHAGKHLYQIALDSSFPHILIRDFAADACRKLREADVFHLDDGQLADLVSINSGMATTGADTVPTGSYDFFKVDRNNERFHFDTMDTLRYWYAPWLRVFEGATTENFLNSAENWIVDAWGVIDEKPYGFREPRENRFSERDNYLSSTSHGSLPTLERYRSHLEWNAKWCAAGEFLAQRPLKKSEYSDADEFSELDYQISHGKLTKPPFWLADFVTNRPLEIHHWSKSFADAAEWVEEIAEAEFLRELFPESEPGWIVVDQYTDTRSERWELNAKISTGLVSPGTAISLVRALQTCPNAFDFYIYPEGHDLEIDEGNFKLEGWIHLNEGDRRIEDKDPLQLGTGQLSHLPGSSAVEYFGLQEVLEDGLKWIDPSSGDAIFRLEMWGDKGADERNRYLGDSVVSSGHRLLMSKSALERFLDDQGAELIADIGLTKRDKSQGKQIDFEEKKGSATYNRLLLLERSGQLKGAEQSFGSWREDCKRAGTD
ncbi:ATP-binding protein [Neptunicoccus cionae]|uniref:ATP-binding protein n=1 Tax=Neptunicoccus cionae TaxID=2035344 RepID=UPI001669830E|nr:ATP-binding protein [Amylibacter cionae]